MPIFIISLTTATPMQQLQTLTPLFHSYTASQHSPILSTLLSVSVPQPQQPAFNQLLQSLTTSAFKHIMSGNNIADLCSLLDMAWLATRNNCIRKQAFLVLLDSVLECVGIVDLGRVLGVIRERVGDLGAVEVKVTLNLLKTINTCLKRISKTTDFQVRGELHMSITRIINFCHESGFDYSKVGAPQTNDKIEIDDPFFDRLKDQGISSSFFEDFWELQKYFMDLTELMKEPDPAQAGGVREDIKLVPLKIKRVEFILDDIVKYMGVNPSVQHKDFANFPLKFLKLSNLLALQLQDSYFRATFLVQAIIFCSSLKVFPAKYQIELSNEAKEAVKRIEKKATDSLEEIIAGRDDAHNLMSVLNSFIKNQAFWIELKDNWRERKKSFFRSNIEEKKKVDAASQNMAAAANVPQNPTQTPSKQPQPQAKKAVSLEQMAARCKKQIKNKLAIWPNFIQSFLSHTEAPVLKKQPISPSFSYFYSQARSCLETFDQTEQCQTQFQSRSEYNLFEWKAFRSMERQRIVRSKGNQKPGNKLADYRLLDFIKRNEELLESEPHKRVKLDDDQEDD